MGIKRFENQSISKTGVETGFGCVMIKV